MARFIFDCEDEVCLPAAYHLVEDAKTFIDKVKQIDISDEEAKLGNKVVLKKLIENMMVKYPAETGKMFSKLWVLEKEEKAPNVFKTMNALFANEVAVDFFTSVLPSLYELLKQALPLLSQ